MSLPDTDEAIRAAVRPWRKEPIYIHPELRAVWNAAIELAARVCERDIVNHKDDPPANYFDGGLRHCAAAVRQLLRDKSC